MGSDAVTLPEKPDKMKRGHMRFTGNCFQPERLSKLAVDELFSFYKTVDEYLVRKAAVSQLPDLFLIIRHSQFLHWYRIKVRHGPDNYNRCKLKMYVIQATPSE